MNRPASPIRITRCSYTYLFTTGVGKHTANGLQFRLEVHALAIWKSTTVPPPTHTCATTSTVLRGPVVGHGHGFNRSTKEGIRLMTHTDEMSHICPEATIPRACSENAEPSTCKFVFDWTMGIVSRFRECAVSEYTENAL